MTSKRHTVLFMGTGDIGLPSLHALLGSTDFQVTGLLTQPDKPAGRGLEIKVSKIKEAAIRAGIPVHQPISLRSAEALDLLAMMEADRPDFVVVVAYGQILPQAFLDIARLACVNIHASLLPRHRGASPVHAAIVEGDKETGVCIVHMTPELDAGDIISEARIQIGRHETAGDLHDRLALLAPPTLLVALRGIVSGTAHRYPQATAAATYAGKMDRDFGRIDWAMDASQIDQLIRGVTPWPGAWTTLSLKEKEVRVKIHEALCLRSSQALATPGRIVRCGDRGLLVAAGRGALLLRELQMEGRKRLGAEDFLRGSGRLDGQFFK